MLLSRLFGCLTGAKIVYQGADFDREVKGLSIDSREVEEGALFICLRGGEKDGHEYVAQAIEKGASALVVERVLPVDLPQIVVADTRIALALLAAAYYGRPSEQLRIVGVTGTNGKTTTTHMLASILRRAGKKVGTIGTLGIFYGKKELPSTLTTPDPIYLHKIYSDMLSCGIEYVVQEVSAHALYYHKDAGIKYSACIFTNLTQDHLDFFKEMTAYREAKLQLFSPDKCPIAIVNSDDASSKDIFDFRKGLGVYTYGLDTPSDCFAVKIREGLYAQELMLNLSDDLCRVSLKMVGEHNVYNALAAASCAYKMGIGIGAIAAGLSEMQQVDGRLQFIGTHKGGVIFVDFAHTPDGLKNSLSTLKKRAVGRLICVFGCGGNRDRGKRPIMGTIAATIADFCVLTSDNPRYEEPLDVIDEIEKGYKEVSKDYVVVSDREAAIDYAMGILREGDVLLIAGKGGEDTQEIMGIKHPFKDQDVVRKIIAKKEKFDERE